MGEEEKNANRTHRSRSWIRWLFIGLGILFLLLVVFHGPILRAVIRTVAIKVAAGQNLKLDFRLEGDPLDEITLRNVHASPTGPTAVQALDAGEVKVDYSLPDLVFHGVSKVLKNVEAHDVTAVIDSSKAPLPTPTPIPDKTEKVSLPAYFPDRLVATNVNLTIRQQPQDMVIKNLNLGLYPKKQGALRIDRVAIPGVNTWTNITATTTYADKNLFLHNLTLDANNKFETVNIDASQLAQGKVGVKFKGTVGGGQVASQIELSTDGTAYQTNTNVHAQDISLAKLGELIGKSPGELSGDVKNADIDLKGSLDQPASWNGTIATDIINLQAGKMKIDSVKIDAIAAGGQATIKQAQIDAGNNHVTLRGAIDLPKTTAGFGQTPGNFQIAIDAPDLAQLTSFLTPPATGALQATGNLKTGHGAVSLDLNAIGDLINYQGAAIKKLTATISATKKMPPPNESKEAPQNVPAPPVYDGLVSTVHAALSDVRYGAYAIDQVAADVRSDGANVSLAPLTVTRNNNLLRVSGTFQLPQPNEKMIDQPADLQLSMRAPQLSDYWQSDAPNKVTGALQADGAIRLRKGVATGQVNVFGQEIAAQKLLVKQLSLQSSIVDNTVFLNDLTATLNEQDYINAHGTVKLAKPFPYTGVATVNLADLSTFEPLLATAEKKTPLAGSLVLNWNGHGEAANFQNDGDLKLKLENGRYADLQNLQANVDAHYTPQELNVPIVYVGSDKLNFQSSLTAKGETLEVSKVEINQGASKYATGYISLPFRWSNLGTDRKLIPADGKVAINFQSENLDLAKLFRDLGKEPPVAGSLN